MSNLMIFRMPDAGEGLTEAEILSWRVRPGDVVAINDVIAEVETAKAAVELSSPYAGIVAELHFPEGATVAVGEPIISITEDTATLQETADSGHDGNHGVLPAQEIGEREAVMVGYGTRAEPATRRARKPTDRPRAAAASPVGAAPGPPARIRTKPLVRKLARELGVDLDTVIATGPVGLITRGDVEAAASREPTSMLPGSAVQHPGETRIPIRGVRRHTAEAVTASAFTAPHVTEWLTADVTRSLQLLDRLRAHRQFAGLRLSPLVLVMRAALLAIGRYPEINARWDGEKLEIVQLSDVNLGIATATPRGLVVPNISAAQRMSVRELAEALASITADARAGRTLPAQMRGGTFTITNIGVFGIDGGTPILNPGEAAILCLGQISRRPWEHKGRVKLRQVTTLALSFDHRLVDGELGSRVLAAVAQLLEAPDWALAL